MNNMNTAPTDRPIRLHMPDGTSFMAESSIFQDENDEDVRGWVSCEEGKEPDDWSQGVCWALNEAGKPSTKPVGWSH